MDQRLAFFCECEIKHRQNLGDEDLSSMGMEALRRSLAAEFLDMKEIERDLIVDLYRSFETNMETANEKMNGNHQYWRSVIKDGHHLSRRDPDFSVIKGFKQSAEEVQSLTNAFLGDVQMIIQLRQKHAHLGALAWLDEYKSAGELIVDEMQEEIAEADLVLGREPPPTRGVKIKVDLTAREKRLEGIFKRFTELPLDPNHFNGHWQNVLDLGGGISRAGLWAKLDRHGRIVDRVVRKNDYMDMGKWFSADYWHGHPKDIYNRVPLEFHLQQKCSGVSDRHFAKMRAYSQDHKNMILSLYINWCAHGDLRKIHTDIYYRTLKRHVPEAALWMIFKQMVECCLIMRQGGINFVDKDWNQIIHRDIKTNNVFMDTPQHHYFPLYPTPKMGDFGLAVETYEDDPLNPTSYLYAGTRPLLAPELFEYENSETHEPVDQWKLWDYTNVYGIGATMYDIISGPVPGNFQPEFLDEKRDKWRMTLKAENVYSANIRDLVMDCIEWNPSKRPTLEQLLEEIEYTISAFEYLEDASEGDQIQGQEPYDLMYPVDAYAVGMATYDAAPDPEETENEAMQEQAPGASFSFSTTGEEVLRKKKAMNDDVF